MHRLAALLAISCLVAPIMGAPGRLHPALRAFSPMKIVGGEQATLGQFPHQVSFQIPNGSGYMHYCGGSIVTPNLIITAAHCLQSGTPASQARIIAGVTKYADETTGQVRGITTITSHPDFDMSWDIVNDIGFLILDEPLELNENVQTIAVAPKGSDPSSAARACTASGWGNSQVGDPSSPDLMFVNIDFIPDAECVDMWNDVFVTVYPEMNICAGTDAGWESVCQGDSGGPLICEVEGGNPGERLLFGATSWGSTNCGEPGRPAAWTEVPNYLDWVQEESGITIGN